MNAEDSGAGVAVAPSEAPTPPAETPRGGGRDNVHPMAAKTHGAHSEPDIAPLRTEHLARLQQRFPVADPGVLFIQAERMAQLALLGEFFDGKPGLSSVIRNRRTSTIWPAREYAAKIAGTYERTNERLEAQQAAAKNGGLPAPSLQDIAAEYRQGGADGGGEDG